MTLFLDNSSALLTIFLIVLSRKRNLSKKLPTTPSNCTVLDKCVFENFILVDEPFAKSLRILKTCIS